jgi:hypothetical protein
MSICTGIGNGIGGAIGKWGAGLGSALGLAGVVDIGVRSYTGYGLVEMLTVPYIECPDGSFASAMEWYGSGLKCPVKKPEPSNDAIQKTSTSTSAVLGYDAIIAALGGKTYTHWGIHWTYEGSTWPGVYNPLNKWAGGHGDPKKSIIDLFGNIGNWGNVSEGTGMGNVRGPIQGEGFGINKFGYNYGDGGWGSMLAPPGYPTKNYLTEINPQLFNRYTYTPGSSGPESTTRMTCVGIRTIMPNNYEKAPPAANLPPPPGFQPNPPRKNREDCEEVACPCLTPADIERAVRKAIGLLPFAPEKLVREMGAKMYTAPGPSLIPIVPTTLVDAIAAIQATSYMRAGYARYPVVMPSSLINDNSVTDAAPTLPIENYAEWFEWWIKQQDSVQGEWPIEIAIVDGAKRQPLKFENMSEAFAELTGLVIQTATDADAAVSVASHAAVAATKSQTAAIIAQKNVECLIKFFGVRTGYGSIFVDAVITPMDSNSPSFNLKKFLTPSKQSIAFFTDNDPFDFQATLDRILRNSEISKSAVAMDASKEVVGDYARNQRNYDAFEARKEAEKELEKLQTSLNTQNPDFKVKIQVNTPSVGEIQGNNFVIKRPKT